MKEQKGHTKTQITDRAKDWHLTVNPRGKKGKVITSEDKDDTICILTKNGTENLNIYIQIYTTKKSPKWRKKMQIKRVYQVSRKWYTEWSIIR